MVIHNLNTRHSTVRVVIVDTQDVRHAWRRGQGAERTGGLACLPRPVDLGTRLTKSSVLLEGGNVIVMISLGQCAVWRWNWEGDENGSKIDQDDPFDAIDTRMHLIECPLKRNHF